MIHAHDLRATAQEKIRQDQEDMEAWVENLADSVTDACQECADEGEMSEKFDVHDLTSFMDADIPEEKIETVIRGTAALLTNHGYKVTIDDFNVKTKSQGDITGITVDWSGK